MTKEVVQVALDRSPHPGALKPGVRPGVDGWYWCKRQGFAAPECVYVIAPYSRAADEGKVFSVNHGEQQFLASSYAADDVKWFGPVSPPAAGRFW